MGPEGVRQLSRGRWAVRVKRVDAATGRVCNRKATIAGTRAQALQRRDELRAELARSDRKAGREHLRTYVLAWLERRRGAIKASTARKYSYAIRHVVAKLGALYVDAITPSDVIAYVSSRMLAAAANTVMNELRMLRVIARDTVADGLAARYWCERVKGPKVTSYGDDNPNLLSPAQAQLVLAHVPAHWLGLLLFVITTGVRIGEATSLRWSDVDVEHGIAKIRRGNDRGTESSTKNTNSVRAVALLPEVLAAIDQRDMKPDNLLFPTRRGTMHRGSPLRVPLEQACAAAGVPRVTTHGLRRTFNNEGRQVGDREVLKATTGHATDAMVSHYSHVAAGEKHELARAVATRLGVLKVSSTS
jgi:integrase